MRIAYVVPHDTESPDGVTKKVRMQIDSWRAAGHEVLSVTIARGGSRSTFEGVRIPYQNPYLRRVLPSSAFRGAVRDFNPNLVYLRYDGWSVDYEWLGEQYVTVAEVNTNVRAELRLRADAERSVKHYLASVSHSVLDGRLVARLSGVVSVTREIAQEFESRVPTVVVPNGIVLRDHPTLLRNGEAAKRPGIFFMGSGGYKWHGTDIIASLASQLPQFDFHVVGEQGVDTPNLRFHGRLDEKQYLEVLSTCQVCLGTLALHRKQMREACPLKTREYLARGFPVIIAYEDTAFAGSEVDFLLKIETRDGQSPDLGAVRLFVERLAGRVVQHSELSAIDAEFTERTRLNFFSQLLRVN